jgi:hypothetical protein
MSYSSKLARIAAATLGIALCAFTNIPMQSVEIRALDKQTGRTRDLAVPVGESAAFDGISISARACYVRPADETPESSAYLEVFENRDSRRGDAGARAGSKQIFAGWMFASSPALSAMEHPTYDIWVLGCK